MKRILILGGGSLVQALIQSLDELGQEAEALEKNVEYIIRCHPHDDFDIENLIIIEELRKPCDKLVYRNLSKFHAKQAKYQIKKAQHKHLSKKGFGRFNNPFIN